MIDYFSRNATELLACSFYLVSAMLCCVLLRQKREARALARAISGLSSAKPLPGETAFADRALNHIWQLVKFLNSSRARVTETERTYEEILNLSITLAGKADKLDTAAAEVCRLLMRKGGRALAGIAVVLADGSKEELQIRHLTGLPKSRFEGIILSYVEKALQSNEATKWDYIPSSHTCPAAHAFDIRLCLTVPLSMQQGSRGALWLAFRSELNASTEQKNFFQLMAEHTAATFRTARKVHQQTSQAERERDFLLGMSHDLRAPGQRALYAIRDLRNHATSLSISQLALLDAAERAIVGQLDMVGDVLKFAQHNKGVLEAQRARTTADEICEDLLESYKLSASHKNLRFLHESVPPVVVYADQQHAKRILENLLDNAIKYTEEGTISLSFHKTESHLEILVADTGIGIPLDVDSSLLFEQFVRMPNSGPRLGAGLGLSLARILAEANHGYVFYQQNTSAPHGSIFGVGLPLALDVSPDSDFRHFVSRVLIVDDDPSVCETLERSLSGTAEDILWETNAARARARLQTEEFDLLISDLHIGDEQALSLISSAPTLPTIIVTGASDVGPYLSALAHPQLVVLEKPVARGALLQALRLLFQRRPNSPAAPPSGLLLQ